MKCKHLVICDEAYSGRTRAAAFLCSWPDTALRVAPLWVDHLIGGGSLITDPKTQCEGCPCFCKQTETNSSNTRT